jgi:radical SAM protein with 4Fe4S-binding SPASM domain
MSEVLFNKISQELATIDYDGDICLALYNEPLLCTNLERYIKLLKSDCPRSFVYLFTNGDHLTKALLIELENAGLDMLMVDEYIQPAKQSNWDREKAIAAIDSKIAKVGLPPLTFVRGDSSIEGYTKMFNENEGTQGTMIIEFKSSDFHKIAANRAECLQELQQYMPRVTDGHPKLCIKDFISVHIDYMGDVWPCPNYHRDIERHRKYCVGNVLKDSIFDIFVGEKISEYRQQRMFHRETLPCRTCIWDFYTFVTNMLDRPFRDRPSYRKAKQGERK